MKRNRVYHHCLAHSAGVLQEKLRLLTAPLDRDEIFVKIMHLIAPDATLTGFIKAAAGLEMQRKYSALI